MRQLKITKSITNRESASLDKYLQEIGRGILIEKGNAESNNSPDVTKSHQGSEQRPLALCGRQGRLKIKNNANLSTVGIDVNPRFLYEGFKLSLRKSREPSLEFVAVFRKRLVNVFNQKKAFLACALTSEDAVNGIRVV